METRVYSWGDGRPWHSYAAYCRRHFGGRVRKIAVDAGLSCPNRDGTIGSEGCTFCDNRAFTPSYCSPRKSLARQIDEGIAFHAARGRDEGLCLAYFQPFSNTHAPVTRLRELYAEALDHPRISGLVIGTLSAVQTEAGGQIEYGIVVPRAEFDKLVQVFIIKDFKVVE